MRKWQKTILILVIIYILFLTYNNINMMDKRDYVFFDSIKVANETISYNKEIQTIATPLFYERGSTAVLLLHGFGGTPYEVSELAEYLAANNITVYVPLLEGHGTTLKDLSRITWQDPYKDAENALTILQNHYKKVYVGGLCTGGLISLRLAQEHEIEGAISMSTPIFLTNKLLNNLPLNSIFKIIRVLTPYLRRVEYGISKDPVVARKLPSYDRFPVNGLITIQDLTDTIKKDMNKIAEPTLIIQSKWDNRAAPESAEYIYQNINSKDKEVVYLNNSGHVVTMDYDKQKVFDSILNFIKK